MNESWRKNIAKKDTNDDSEANYLILIQRAKERKPELQV